LRSEHAQSAANFHAKRRYGAHGVEHRIKLWALWRLSPSRTHTEAGCAIGLCLLRRGQYLVLLHQLLAPDASVIAGALWTIGAIFRAAAGLDGKQAAHLYLVRGMVLPMHLLSSKD